MEKIPHPTPPIRARREKRNVRSHYGRWRVKLLGPYSKCGRHVTWPRSHQRQHPGPRGYRPRCNAYL